MSYATDTLVPYARKAISAMPRRNSGATSARYAEIIGALRNWNGRADINSRGCALYLYWMLADKGNGALAQKAAAGIPWTQAEAAGAVASLLRAADAMQAQYGKIDVPWSDVHGSRLRKQNGPAVSGLGYFLPGDKTASVTPNFGSMSNGQNQLYWRFQLPDDRRPRPKRRALVEHPAIRNIPRS